jgi:hypothetical protein
VDDPVVRAESTGEAEVTAENLRRRVVVSRRSIGVPLAVLDRMTRVAVVVLALAGCFVHRTCPLYDVAEQQLRNPANGECETFSPDLPCDPDCGPCPYGGSKVHTEPPPDWGTCFGQCNGLAEMQCLAQAQCHATYQDDSAASPVYWGCWDLPPSGAITGTCTNLDAQTCSEHTDCVSIYTGPVNQPQNFVPSFISCKPEVASAACTTLTTEAACKARPDCDAVYTGMNCTCDSNGCTCQTETYSHCETHS